MPAALRVQLSRVRGASIGDAVNIARPGRWGNPFVAGRRTPQTWHEPFDDLVVTQAGHAVALYRALVRESPGYVAEARHHLTGRRLACWCGLGEPCHGDVLLSVIAEASPLPIFRWDLSGEIRRWSLPVPVRLPERRIASLLMIYKARTEDLRQEAPRARADS